MLDMQARILNWTFAKHNFSLIKYFIEIRIKVCFKLHPCLVSILHGVETSKP